MICKISLSDLMVGMHVVDMGLPWVEHPYLFSQEGPVKSEQVLQALREAGYLEAFVDTEKGRLVPVDTGPAPSLPDGLPLAGCSAATPLERELVAAKIVYHDCLLIARDILYAIQAGENIDVLACSDMINAVVDSAVRNAEALLTLCKLRHHDAYTFTHGVNVSVLSVAFGAALGLSGDELKDLGLAGMFHDLGKTGIPEAILNKPDRLTEEEFACIRKHPHLGVQLLQGLDVSEALVRGVGEHHERYDGSGYPRRLAGNAIHRWGRILALTDVYDALTSRRCYKNAMLPTRALSVIYGMRGRDFSPLLAERFIKFLGPYPVGSFVRLTDASLGFVRASNPGRPLLPQVLIVRDPTGQPCVPGRLLDLARTETTVSVKANLDPAAFGLDAADFLLSPGGLRR